MSVEVICPGCGASVPEIEEMRRRPYVGSAPGCFLLCSEVLAREYGDIRYTPAHQLTVLDVHAAATPEGHRSTVDRWARSAWEAWAPHHPQVRAWADELG